MPREDTAYFEKHIRPLFAQQCVSCHGPQKQKGGLRLDQPEFIAKGGETGKIIVPGKPEESLLFKAVGYQDDVLKMPPRGKLSAEQVEHLKQWITQGATLPASSTATKASTARFDLAERSKHWCYQPLRKFDTLSKDFVDQHIAAQWKAKGLTPAAAVSKAVWLRRVTFDLIGLSPTIAEQEAFEKDTSPEAYAKVVDGLLARPEHGERWARHWLDLVRYADTMGHEFDFDISNAWRYRNYVIRAMNADVPYHQFVMEHLAGDLLPTPRVNEKEQWNESVQATGFFWLGEAKQAPVDVRQEQADRIDNQIDVLGKAFLGQTIACARCHDHKFDAIATRDYYALYGVLKSSRYQQLSIDVPERYAGVVQELEGLQREVSGAVGRPASLQGGTVRRPATARSDGRPATAPSSLQWKALGQAWKRETQPLSALFQKKGSKQWQLRTVPAGAWDSGSRSTVLEGSLQSNTVTIDQDYLHVAAAGYGSRLRVVVDGFNVIRDPIYGGLRKLVNEVQPKWYTFDLKMWRGRQMYVECLDGGPADPALADDHAPGRESWMQVLHGELSGNKKPPFDLPTIDVKPMPLDEQWMALSKKREQLDATCPPMRYALATVDGTGCDEHVFIRGNHRLSGEVASRGLSPLFCGKEQFAVKQGSGRLELAQRLIDPARNPLLVRVLVNRVWKHHFGEGLVRTVDDFGKMGDTPSHPELLDALSQWFITEGGWSLKKLHRLLVLSETYRVGSQPHDAETAKRDAERRWLSYLPLRRLEAEAMRDAMLQVAGERVAGPKDDGVMPYLIPLSTGRGRPGNNGPLLGEGARSIYQSIRRNFLPAFMATFDYPTPFTTMGKRSVSNTPAQGLTMMNDPLVQELAKRWAGRLVLEKQPVEERVTTMYRAAFARFPTAEERQAVLEYVKSQTAKEHDVWTHIAHALFSSKEFRYVE